MKRPQIYILFDDVFIGYINHYSNNGEIKLVKDLRASLINLSQTSDIMIITNEDIAKIECWFYRNNLIKFISDISNPMI